MAVHAVDAGMAIFRKMVFLAFFNTTYCLFPHKLWRQIEKS
jgi:hypothetical protein